MESKKGPGKGKHPNSRKNLKPIKKGEVRNPLGAGAHDPIKKAMRKFSAEYLQEVIDAAITGNLEDLKRIAEDPRAPAIKVGVARVLFNAVRDGNWDAIEKVLHRIIGKVPDKVDTTSNGQTLGGPITVNFVHNKKDD